MKIYGFYYVAMMNDWEIVFSEQLEKLQNSKLYANTDKLFLRINNPNNYNFPKISDHKIQLDLSNKNTFEFSSLNKMKQLSKNDDFYCYYFHTKGVSICEENKTFYHGSKNLSHLKSCVSDWRNYMEYYLIDRYEDNIDKLNNGFDACGVQLSRAQNPIYFTFSGNFWWSKSDYIKILPEFTTEFINNRWNAETWIGMGDGKLYNFHTNNAGYMERITENYKI